MSNLLAALGRGQLEQVEAKIARRRQLFEGYREALKKYPFIHFMPELEGCRSTRWLTCITLDPESAPCSPEDIRLALEDDNIESRPLWKPLHLQPLFETTPRVGGAVSEQLFKTGLCLPSGSGLSDDDHNRVIKALVNAIDKRM